MLNLHPMIVHFPIAALTLYVITEIAAFFTNNDKLKFTAQLLLFTGVVTGIGAVLTGNQNAYDFLNSGLEKSQAVLETLENHETYATILLWYFFFILVARTFFVLKKSFTKIRYTFILIFAIAGLYLIWMSGYYGGELVFKYNVGSQIDQEYLTE